MEKIQTLPLFQHLVSHIDLLLNYAKRFHNRQFLTRSAANSDLVAKMEELTDSYLKSEAALSGLPTVNFFAEKLNVSPDYLSDLLRNVTGKSICKLNHYRNKVFVRKKTSF